MLNPIVAYIDGKRCVFDAEEVSNLSWSSDLFIIVCEDGREFYIFEDSEQAGKAAREYWADMAANDPEEFVRLVGVETLVQWGMGHSAGPGDVAVNSLQEWLDLWLDIPEEHFASYDGIEREFVCRHPDFKDYTVAYRYKAIVWLAEMTNLIKGLKVKSLSD